MIWLSSFLGKLRALRDRSQSWPYVGRATFALALTTMILLATQGHHLDNPADLEGYQIQGGKLIAEEGAAPPGTVLKTVSVVLPYLDTWMLVGGAVYIFILLRQWGNVRKLVFPTWVAAVSVSLWLICSDIAHHLGPMQMTEMGEPPALAAYWVKLALLFTAGICVPSLLHYYHRSGIMDRYTLRTFLAPLTFCFVAFTSLWLIMDLLDNLKDFQEAEASLGRVILFYVGILPAIFVEVMPAAILLSILYTLTRMSRSNELVAMLGFGRSIMEILSPLFITALLVATISMAANFYWAPRAKGQKQAVLRGLEGKQKDSIMQSAVMYHDPLSHRTWFISSVPFSMRDSRLRSVQVREQDATGQPTRVIHADSATWIPGGIWRFFDGKEVLYKDGQPSEIRPFPTTTEGRQQIEIRQFEETPWSMVSYALKPDFMGVPEIISYMKAHPKDPPARLAPFAAHFHHRFAMPWQILALTLVAAPLGIAYSRRGAVGGIAGSIFIFFVLLFLNNLCLNLGKGLHIAPWFSSWIPHLLFCTLGIILLYHRSQNKDLPNLSPFKFFKKPAKIVRARNRQAA